MQTNLSLIIALDSSDWVQPILGACVGVLFVAGLFTLRSKWRKRTQQPPVTQTKAAAMRSMRLLHVILCIAIVMYVYVAQSILRPTSVAPPLFIETFSVLCIVTVVIGLGIRRRLLPRAIEGMRGGDSTALGRWRQANVLSMVLAVSVSLYGVAFRAIGGSPQATWPFFIAAAILMWLWRPQPLDETSPIQN
jgi:hypothetical protein